MDDAVDALQRTRNDIPVADIADDEFGIFRKIVGPLAISVDLLDQVIEDANGGASAKKFFRYGASNKSCTACNQHRFPQLRSLPFRTICNSRSTAVDVLVCFGDEAVDDFSNTSSAVAPLLQLIYVRTCCSGFFFFNRFRREFVPLPVRSAV
jgi:hypothetical protein